MIVILPACACHPGTTAMNLGTVMLSRLQFAFTVGFHIL
jgi:hypothetical protein